MAYLGTPMATKVVLERFGFSFQKKFGQNFLIDQNILENIISEAGITKEDFVLETQEDKMAFYDVHDRAVYLLKMKLQQLPEPVQQEIFSILWINQTSEPTS